MTAAPESPGADVIDFASRRRTTTTVTPVDDVPEPELITGKKRTLPTLPSGVGGVVLAAPKACVCCVGRGIKRGGDTWGEWVREKGHRIERAKKTLWWAAGGIVVCSLFAPYGIMAVATVGLIAAVVAGWRTAPASAPEPAPADVSTVGPLAPAAPPSVEAPASPVEAPRPPAPPMQEEASPHVEAPMPPILEAPPEAPFEATLPAPVVSAPQPRQTPVARSGPVAVGPPSTSPLVGRVHPVDVWTEAVRWGIDPYGAPVETILPGNPGLLTGGVSGSGKSVASHQMLCHVALDPHAQLWLVDGKMVELVHYRDIAHEYLDEPDLEAFTDLVDNLDSEMQRRKRAIAGKAVKITGKNWRLYDAPFVMFHIDEAQLYTLQGKDGQKLAQRIALLASQCRALGIFVSVATQRPEDSVVPPLLCNNLVLKLALRSEDASQSNTILGNGMAGRGYRSDRFTADQKGASYYRGEVGDPIALTTGFLRIPDEGEGGPDHVRDIVKVATELRREEGTLPTADDRPSREERLEVVADALNALESAGVDRMSRSDLAAEMGWDEDALRDALAGAGVCSPHPMAGVSGRGWYRRDLEVVMR
ncbi:FtsK/SpoIIIE domain-containing protein [Nocardiopsis sp. NPDC007018]|uniref:FtsK/SpoIIIE domain-containing protein n=1 Tax=Nocardiopsis sp. NPDC007018 TaxID=3155721 RepID=UPI0033D09E19